MRDYRIISFIILAVIIAYSSGCATVKPATEEKSLPLPTVHGKVASPEPEPVIEITSEAIDEYARIHQISDLKEAERRVANPEYAKDNPYVPTNEDIELYEREFMERIYPEFKQLADKEGFIRARRMFMNNPPAGPGSFWVGSRRYGAMMEMLSTQAGGGAVGGETNALLEEDPATVNYKEGMFVYGKGEVDKAIEYLETALEFKPDSPTIHYNIGIMYMDKDDTPKAVQAFQTAISIIKSTGYSQVNLRLYPEVFLGASTNLGMLYTRIGLHDQAVEVLKDAIQFRPDDIEANRNLAITYYTMGDMDMASIQMQKYLQLEPSNAEAHNNLGLIFYKKGQYESALKEFEKARKLSPENKQYAYNEGLTFVEMGRNEEATEAFRDASGLEEGKEMRQKFIQEFEANKWRELYNLGHSAMEIGNYNQAIEHFKSVLEIKPDMLEAYVNLGYCYRSIGNRENQIYYFEKAWQISPESADINHNLGLAYSDSKMYQKAIERFIKVTELKPSFRDAYFSLGTAYYNTVDYANAAKAFDKAVEISPQWFEARQNLGSTYLKIGNIKGATEQFVEAVKINPNSAEAYYNLGIAYMKDGRYDESETEFQKALKISPGHRMSRIMLKEIEAYRNQ